MSFLSPDQMECFRRDGFLVVPDVLPEAFLLSIERDYDELLSDLAENLYREGKLSSCFRELSFAEKYGRVLNECPAVYNRLGISLPLVKDSTFMPRDARAHTSEVMLQLLTHDGILDIVESVLGPEILSNPTQHTRIKPSADQVPAPLAANTDVAATIWHQDQSGYLDEAKDSRILTVWVAVTDATPENGCLTCVAGSHVRRELTLHCPQKDRPLSTFIPARLIDPAKITLLPVSRGGVILLDQYTEHASLSNRSNSIRWSFDLRYNPVGQPTGRPVFPSFIARSRRPGAARIDAEQWSRMWEETRERILSGRETRPLFNDMGANASHPLCA